MGFEGTSLPEPREAGDVVGGHALLLVGFDLEARVWRVRNSWGTGWGESGYAWLPWAWTGLPWCGEAHALRAIRRAA
jgi:C1A family cysteine protease